MNKTTLALITVVLLFSSVDMAYAHTPGEQKLKQGIKDLITAPLGFFTHTSDRVHDSDDKFLAVFYGLAEGTDTLVGNTISGVVNILTFPFSNQN